MLRRFRCNYRGCLIVCNVLKAAWLRHFPCCAYIDGAVEPVGPVAPVGPGIPWAPVAPVAPVAPRAPGVPGAPVGPVGPVAPGTPWPPLPADPWGPVGPVGPVGPGAPGMPGNPCIPSVLQFQPQQQSLGGCLPQQQYECSAITNTPAFSSQATQATRGGYSSLCAGCQKYE